MRTINTSKDENLKQAKENYLAEGQSKQTNDVSQVQAYTTNKAATANKAMKSEAYATNKKIAFSKSNPNFINDEI
jgi:hypothetical protein